MAAPRYRAWHFIHADFDAAEGFCGLRTNATGGIDMIDGERSVRQAILLLLSTRPGERVMRPDYGCDLHKLVFSPNDDTTAGLAMHYVRRALARWEPRIEILRLDASQHAHDPSRLDVVLDYRVSRTAAPGQVTFGVDLMQSEA